MTRKTLAASALGATLLLGGPQIASAESANPTPAEPTATATATEQVNTTVEKKDRTGLWGLLGLAGLAGLAGLKKKPEQHTTVRPAHVEHREPGRTNTTDHVRANNVRDEQLRGDNLRNDLHDGKLDRDLNNDGRRDV